MRRVDARIDDPDDHGFVVPAKAGRFVVDYTGFHLRAADQVRFAYKLDGVDRDWIQAGTSRTAIYTNVPPGRHVFRLMGRNASTTTKNIIQSAFLIVECPINRASPGPGRSAS